MSKNLEDQRTYALVGTGGCGKTSLAEMLLFRAGVVNRLGKVEDGSTCLDYEPEEIKRHGSIQAGFAHYFWDKNTHFLIDTPGDTNFTGDISYSLLAADAVVFVVDAVDGVRPLTRRLWEEVRKNGLPAMVFINKMDRDRADFDMAFDGLAGLGMKPRAVIHAHRQVHGVSGAGGHHGREGALFPGRRLRAGGRDSRGFGRHRPELRETAVENIAESDEAPHGEVSGKRAS